MTRRKRTGPAGKRRQERSSGIALFDEKGTWLGKFDVETGQLTTTTGRLSSLGTKAHNKRAIAALAWITEHRPDLLAEAIEQEEEERDDEEMADTGATDGFGEASQ